jgi:hypothetical protein
VRSSKASGTFCGSPAHTDPQKVSDLHRLFTCAHEEALLQWTHCRKDIPKEQMGLEKPQRVAHFRALRPSLGQDQRAGCRRVESWSVFERMGEEHTYPIHSQLAKVEL